MSASRQNAALVLERLESLPSLPDVAARLLRAAEDPDLDARTVAPLIETDPGLASRVLALCRTAEKGLGGRITSVRQAVVTLGIDTIRTLVLGVVVYDLMREAGEALDLDLASEDVRGPLFDRDGHWRFALSTACLSWMLARSHPELGCEPDEAYLAGLLHDVGKPALDLCLPRSYRKVLDVAEARRVCSSGIERELIGMDHHEAGRLLGDRWGLPDQTIDAIWLHGQDPSAWEDREEAGLISLVSAAAEICRSMHLGWSGDFEPPTAIEVTARRAGLKAHRVGEALEELPRELETRIGALGLSRESGEQLLVRSVFSSSQHLAQVAAELEHRSRTDGARREAVEEIDRFGEETDGVSSVARLIEAVAGSATRALGVHALGAVWQGAGGSAWSLIELGADGRVCEFREIERSSGMDLHSAGNGIGQGAPVSEVLPREDLDGFDGSRALVVGRGDVGLVLLVRDGEEDTWPTRVGREPFDALLRAWGRVSGWVARASVWEEERSALAAAARRVRESQPKVTEMASLARVGEMTAAAAHELNTPLAVIGGRAQHLLRSGGDASKVEATARSILSQVEKMDAIVAGLHELSAGVELDITDAALTGALERASDDAIERCGAEVAVRIECALGGVRTDHVAVERMVFELVCNAIEAGARNVVVRAEDGGADSRMVVSVVDDGCGLSETAARHAFDPLFSEKPVSRRLGLGLSRVRRLSEALGGEVSLRRRKGGGAEATLRLSEWPDEARIAA